MAKTITAANSVFLLSVAGLYASPQRLQGYAADAAFDTDTVENVETVMGVDGNMSAGYMPAVNRQTVTLMPDSPSSVIFETWQSAQQQARDVFFANGSVTLPSTQRKYTMTRGVLSSAPPIPGVRKTLQARAFVITWQSIVPAPF